MFMINCNCRYKYLVLGHKETFFVKKHFASRNKHSEDDNIKILEFLVDNMFGIFSGKVFQQTSGIPMGTNFAPVIADIFLYSYEAEFMQSLLSTGRKQYLGSISQVHRWCIFHTQPRFRILSWPDVSCWTWDQRHHREHYFCFLSRFTSVDLKGW